MSDRHGWSCRIGCAGLWSTKAYRDEHFRRCHPKEHASKQFANRIYSPETVCRHCDGCFHTKADLVSHACDSMPDRECGSVAVYTAQPDLFAAAFGEAGGPT
jgi:recombinational DNA repair protein RecR